jgi:hypothetical protein
MSNIIKLVSFLFLAAISIIVATAPVESAPEASVNAQAQSYELLFDNGDLSLSKYDDLYCTIDNTSDSNPDPEIFEPVIDCFGLVSEFTNPEIEDWRVMYFDNGLVCQGYGELEDCFFDESNDV